MTEKIYIKGKAITLIGKDQSEIDIKKVRLGILPAIEPVKKKSRKKHGTDSADIYKTAKENIIHKED